jgi:hypothetical protein
MCFYIAIPLRPCMTQSSGTRPDGLAAPRPELVDAGMQSHRLGAIARFEPLFPKPQA